MTHKMGRLMGEVGKTVPRVLVWITVNGRKCTEKRGTN